MAWRRYRGWLVRWMWILYALASASAAARAQLPDGAAAIVNGVAISRKAVREIVMGIASLQGEEEHRTHGKEWEQSALESLIDFELLFQEARRQGVTVTPEEIDKEIERSQRKFGDEREWRRVLSERGWTIEDLRKDTERMLTVQRFLETVVWRHAEVSAEAIEKFYEKNQNDFRHPSQVRLRHAVIRPRGTDEPAWRAAQREAEQVRARWREVNVAGRSSAAPIPQLGEDLGWVSPGELEPDVEAVVFGLAPGEVSEPLRRPDGMHLFAVTARREEGTISLEDARPKIEAVLRKRERQRLRDELVARLRQQADIRYR
ncbi:MAG: hypothetical protein KatS3mg077_2952 [Candidatus Binatia bacterium]|nr:MAG: hypothetical protein KatS3mg077_2952 [Candidatus Binatia bacterium]